MRELTVARLRTSHEAQARALLGIPEGADLVAAIRTRIEGGTDPEVARQAAEALGEAEQYQWEIGSWATGSGEGLSSMYEVRCLQLAQAWLLSAEPDGQAEALSRSRALLEEVEADPNRVAQPLTKHIRALAGRLGEGNNVR